MAEFTTDRQGSAANHLHPRLPSCPNQLFLRQIAQNCTPNPQTYPTSWLIFLIHHVTCKAARGCGQVPARSRREREPEFGPGASVPGIYVMTTSSQPSDLRGLFYGGKRKGLQTVKRNGLYCTGAVYPFVQIPPTDGRICVYCCHRRPPVSCTDPRETRVTKQGKVRPLICKRKHNSHSNHYY